MTNYFLGTERGKIFVLIDIIYFKITLPLTSRFAVDLDLPMENWMVPVISTLVFNIVSLWMVPSCCMMKFLPACKAAPFRNHLAGFTDGMEVSHSKLASSGSVTSSSHNSFTILMACSGWNKKAGI